MDELRQNTKLRYKVVILTAGRGSRLAPLTDSINKALLPVAGQAVISHIIKKFSPGVEIAIAVGYEQEKVKEYVSLAHPEYNITFVEVDMFEAKGSGPGYSLLACRETLQCPFIFFSVDTLVDEEIPLPTQDWLGVAPVQNTASYNTVRLENGFVMNMKDKEVCDNTHAFIGVCGIHDFVRFWQAMENDTSLIAGERQVGGGLKALLTKGMAGVEFTWHDTGTRAGYEETCRYHAAQDEEFDFSKTGEHIYFVADKVIKFFADSTIARRRIERAEAISGFTPTITAHTNHFYSYNRVAGSTMYQALTARLAGDFFDWLQSEFWRIEDLTTADQTAFTQACFAFYHDKTLGRVGDYYLRTAAHDTASVVNGTSLPPLSDLLAKIDWDKLAEGTPSRFHGDLQFDNVLVTNNPAHPFVLLDWRQDFAGLTSHGDLYYDLAKLYGGHIIPYHLIKKNMFSCEEKDGEIFFDMASTYALSESRAVYEIFLVEHGYDIQKVRLLTALIFLNMSPLHTAPFNKLLHHLGRLELQRALTLQPVAAYA